MTKASCVSRDALHIDESAAHDLTGRTGSFMYMAPEVYKAQQYNEKADVFSFGVVMYEVFSRLAMSTVVVGPTGDPAAAKVYANKVCLYCIIFSLQCQSSSLEKKPSALVQDLSSDQRLNIIRALDSEDADSHHLCTTGRFGSTNQQTQ